MDGQKTSISCVDFERRHLPEVVDLHISAFPGFFLSFLGPRFLSEFYGAFLADVGGIAKIAEDQNKQVVGFVFGTFNATGFFRRLLWRRWPWFVVASSVAVMRRPTVVKRLVRALIYRGETPKGHEGALLSSIAVAPSVQNAGIGRMLMIAWVNGVRSHSITNAYLVTDAVGNDKVNAFYRRYGWRVDCKYVTPEGREMLRYVLDIRDFTDKV